MAAQLLDDRRRAFGLAAALAIHLLAIAVVVLLSPPWPQAPPAAPGLVALALDEPPPVQPPPEAADPGEAAPPSRGESEAPAPPDPPVPLARPTLAEPPIDPGSQQASGLGGAAGAGAGQGGEGSGAGTGLGGSGSGAATPPQRIAGALTNADYRRTRPPPGAAGTVVVSYRVRADGEVDRCTVLRSSGYEILDRATCRLIERRFRYAPARDAAGRAIDWEIRTDYTWQPR